MIGESKLIDASGGPAGSASFTTHNSDRVLVRVVPSSGATCTVQIYGTATSLESDTGTLIDSKTGVDDEGYLLSLENLPCYKVTVKFSDLTAAATLSCYTFVGGVQ